MAAKIDLHEGQELKVTNTRRPDTVKTGRIVKVGRSLVHIDLSPDQRWDNIIKFKIDNQHEAGDFGSYRFWLPGEHEKKIEFDGLVRELRDLGVRLDYAEARRMTADQLRRILAIVEEGPISDNPSV